MAFISSTSATDILQDFNKFEQLVMRPRSYIVSQERGQFFSLNRYQFCGRLK